MQAGTYTNQSLLLLNKSEDAVPAVSGIQMLWSRNMLYPQLDYAVTFPRDGTKTWKHDLCVPA
jgi:hypothetical protein